MATFWWDALLLGAAQQQSTPPAAAVAGPMQCTDMGFVANYGGQGSIDPGMQKTEGGV